jgi:protein-S-isoprenylcysteine O-methyltransferase
MISSSILFFCLILGLSELCLNLFKHSKVDAVSKDRNSLGLIFLLDGIGGGLAVYLFFKLPGWTLPWKEQFYVFGLCLFVAGVVLRWYAIIYLGRFFTTDVAIAKDHRIIDSGPYRLLRHPSYTGSLLIFLGFSLCIGNTASFLVMMLFFSIGLLQRIRIEELALTEAFGERYRAYMRKTKRLIPFVY